MNSLKVFIIILNWNGWNLTKRCLDSLDNLNYDNYKIIVVDNGSKKLEKQKIKDSEKDFILVENQSNLGFAGGNNEGVKYALKKGADYVLLLNNDAICDDKNFLKKMIEIFEEEKNTGIIGPKIYFPDKKTIWFGGGKLNWLKTKGYHLNYGKKNINDKIKEVDYITGCCFLIKKETIRDIGLMQDDYFLYYEDADWCLRAKKAGYKCVYNPEAYILHEASSSAKEFSDKYIYYHSRNALMLAWRHNNMFKKTLVLLFSFWKLAKQSVKLIFDYKRRWAKLITKGILDFYFKKYGKYKNS